MLRRLARAVVHAVRLVASRRRERLKSTRRDPRWNGVRDGYLRDHPVCAACGGRQELQVHHIRPFALHPELELDRGNLVTLCMGPLDCHLLIGHGGSFDFYNPRVVHDAKEAKATFYSREKIESDARAARQPLTVPKAA